MIDRRIAHPAPSSPSEAPAHELHHAAPRCLLRLHDAAVSSDLDGAGIQAWMEFEHECVRWGIDVEIAREDLSELIACSAVVLEREKHRILHASDFKRWGRRGGLATLRRYGRSWYGELARKRWGRISAEDLEAAARASLARPCACVDGTVYLGVEDDGVECVEAVPCRRCAGGAR
jgi:hypothetical protein